MEQRFSIVILVLILISLGIWSYSNWLRSTADTAQINKEVLAEIPTAPSIQSGGPTIPSNNSENSKQVPRPVKSPKNTSTQHRIHKTPAEPNSNSGNSGTVIQEAMNLRNTNPVLEADKEQPQEKLEIIKNEFYTLVYNFSNSKWYNCKKPTWDINGMTCESLEDFTNILPALVVGENENRKSVSITRFDGQMMVNYVYRTSGPSGAGFYTATFDSSTGKYIPTNIKYIPINKGYNTVSIDSALSVQFNETNLVERP